MTSNANIQYYKNTQIEYAEPNDDVIVKIGCNDLTDKGVVIDYDITGVPKRFKIDPIGMSWTDGVNTFNTSLDKIGALGVALPAVEIAPNSTTFQVNKNITVTNGVTNTVTVDAATPNIIISDGTTTNTIDKNGITTRNTVANATHYLNFSDSSGTGTGPIQKTAGISCNPSLGTITATTFDGGASTVAITDNNTFATYYPTFVSNNTGNLALQVDKTTNPLSYNPSTGSLSASIFTGLLSSGGLVFLSNQQQGITGSASPVNFNITNVFIPTYKNYRIVIAPTTQLSFTTYPSYSIAAFLGTGTQPTTGNTYVFEYTTAAPATPVVQIGLSVNLASTPFVLAVSQSINHQTIIDIENVGYSNTQPQQVGLKCQSFYNNATVAGSSNRSLQAQTVSGCSITGLTIQQSSIGAGNNFNIGYTIYGYKIS